MGERYGLRLGDVITIKHGYAFKGEYFSDTGPGPLLITPGNFAIGGGFKTGKSKYYLGPVPEGYRMKPGDLIVTMTDLSKSGDTLGYPALIPDGIQYLHNQRVGLVHIEKINLLERSYLYYALQNSDYRNYILAGATGSTVRHTSPSRIYDYTLSVPSIYEQRAIAAILRALDDKVSNNERIARTALYLADIYFENEVCGVERGPLTFGAVAAVHGGGTPSTTEPSFWDGSIPWATPSDVTALSAPYLFSTSRTISDAGLDNCASSLYPAESIFMTSRATIGSFAIPHMPSAVNQGFIVVVPPFRELRWWLYHEMKSRVDEMVNLANGSTFLELSRKNFKEMHIRLPGPETIERFEARVNPLHYRSSKCIEESVTLMQLRDTLLPKLMSGEIQVRDAEKVVEEVT